MIKRIICVAVVFFCVILSAFSNVTNKKVDTNIAGRWAEKISERVVMDIYPDRNGEYYIYITWRENNLAQKDIYRLKAKDNGDGSLKYKNGIHIYRFYDSYNKIRDEIDYTDGSGIIKISNNELIWIDNKNNQSEPSFFIPANKELVKDTTVKAKLFSIMLPEEAKGFYEAIIKKNKISIYDKSSKQSGFGGFAFGIALYENPSDHAMLPGGKKIGEYVDKRGKVYDVVIKYPTDVQYDYVDKKSDSYDLLYNSAEIIGKNLMALRGGKYSPTQGTDGKNMYEEVLQKHITAIQEKWDSSKLEQENMSYMYNVLSGKDVLNKIGYVYFDVNGDGIDELLIGEIGEGDWKGIIYDIYTMVNRKPVHVVSGGARNRYYVSNDYFLCNEYSSGALESGWLIYILVENSTELFPQVGFKYDGYENPKKPWFLSYNFTNNDWQNVSESTFKERKSVFDGYKRFDFIPLSSLINK